VSEERTPKGAWGITALLFSFMLINFADKTVVGLAAVPIMRDLDLTPRQFGFLGSSFSFLFAISGILVGLSPTISPPAGCFSPSHFPGRSCSFRWLAQPGSRRWWLVASSLARAKGRLSQLRCMRSTNGSLTSSGPYRRPCSRRAPLSA
jgi:hypothetical protein